MNFNRFREQLLCVCVKLVELNSHDPSHNFVPRLECLKDTWQSINLYGHVSGMNIEEKKQYELLIGVVWLIRSEVRC